MTTPAEIATEMVVLGGDGPELLHLLVNLREQHGKDEADRLWNEACDLLDPKKD